MTASQKIKKILFPVIIFMSGIFKKNNRTITGSKAAKEDFFALKSRLNDSREFDFTELKGKKTLIVNTASDCGYTAQYSELQTLYEAEKNRLSILAFPSNDFLNQENYDDTRIGQFCKTSFGVTFPIMKKGIVICHSEQQEVYRWLSDKNKNGWNDTAPTWNFCKYLIDENGNLTHFFEAAVSPLGKEMQDAIRH